MSSALRRHSILAFRIHSFVPLYNFAMLLFLLSVTSLAFHHYVDAQCIYNSTHCQCGPVPDGGICLRYQSGRGPTAICIADECAAPAYKCDCQANLICPLHPCKPQWQPLTSGSVVLGDVYHCERRVSTVTAVDEAQEAEQGGDAPCLGTPYSSPMPSSSPSPFSKLCNQDAGVCCSNHCHVCAEDGCHLAKHNIFRHDLRKHCCRDDIILSGRICGEYPVPCILPGTTIIIPVPPTASVSMSPVPSYSASSSATMTSSPSPTASVSMSPSASVSLTPTPTTSVSMSPSPSASVTPSATASVSMSPSASVSLTPTASVSMSPTASVSMSQSPSSSMSSSVSVSTSPSASVSMSPTTSVSMSPLASTFVSPMEELGSPDSSSETQTASPSTGTGPVESTAVSLAATQSPSVTESLDGAGNSDDIVGETSATPSSLGVLCNTVRGVCCDAGCGVCAEEFCGQDSRGGFQISIAQRCCSEYIYPLGRDCARDAPPCVIPGYTPSPSVSTSLGATMTGAMCNEEKAVCCEASCRSCAGGTCAEDDTGRFDLATANKCCAEYIFAQGRQCGIDSPPCILTQAQSTSTPLVSESPTESALG